MLTRLIQGEDNGERLTAKELLHNCIFLLNAGHETTTNLIGNGLVALSANPAQKKRLIEHPDLIKTAVEEILRFESSNQLGNRMTTERVELGGIALAAGTPVTLCIGAANRDPAQFADPENLDIGRTPNRHLAFATGAHQCAGMALARLEGAIAISRFLARFPDYALNGAPVRGGRARFRGFLSVPCCGWPAAGELTGRQNPTKISVPFKKRKELGMRNALKIAPLLSCLLVGLLAAPALAQDAGGLKKSGILDQLLKQTGVYNRSNTGKTPGFVSDPAWPQPLPHNWLLGQIGGLYVDSHDHIWVYNRPRTLTNDEAGLEKPCRARPTPRASRSTGWALRAPMAPAPIAATPRLRCWNSTPTASCCAPGAARPIPASSAANARRTTAASGPTASTASMSTRRTMSGSPAMPPRPSPAPRQYRWTTNKEGGDGFVLKFDMNGNFKMRIGGTPSGPDSNDTNGGINGTPLLYQPADMVVDPKTNRLYVADGYGNRRVLIVDADTGKYIGHFGAYGNNPVDDAGAAAAGTLGRTLRPRATRSRPSSAIRCIA